MPEELVVGSNPFDFQRMHDLQTDLEQWITVRQVGARHFAKEEFVDRVTRWEVSCQKQMAAASDEADALFTR